MAHDGVINKRDRNQLKGSNMTTPKLLSPADVTDEVSEHIADIIDDRAEEIFNKEDTKQQISNIESPRINALQAQIDAIVIEGGEGADPRVSQALVDASGYTYSTLKERLDTENTEIVNPLITDIYNKHDGTLQYAFPSSTSRWFFPVIVHGFATLTIAHPLRTSDLIYYIEVWEKNGSVLNLTYNDSITVPANTAAGEIVVLLPYYANNAYISIKTNINSIIGTYADSSESVIYADDASVSTLNISDLKNYNGYAYYAKVTVKTSEIYEIARREKPSIITVGKGKDFSNIQDAIDSCNDSESNPITIVIYPGTYPRFSMVGFPNITGNWSKNILRNISLVGIDKKHTIIKDTVGDYRTPAAEIRTTGLIKNLTFIASHEDAGDVSEWSDGEGAKARRSYAVHCDFGEHSETFEDCDFISYQAPAIGVGLYQDDDVRFINCTFTTYASSDWLNSITTHGAFYCHSRNASNVTNQKLSLRNCVCHSIHISKGADFLKIGTGGDATIESIGSTYYSDIDNSTVYNTMTKAKSNHGNNAAALNN